MLKVHAVLRKCILVDSLRIIKAVVVRQYKTTFITSVALFLVLRQFIRHTLLKLRQLNGKDEQQM